MRKAIVKAPAKINLGCCLFGKLVNNYHELETIYTQVSLFDIIKINRIDNPKIELFASEKRLPLDNRNLVYKAVELLQKETKINKRISIFIEKHIPIGSGLGGGSADAAAVLKTLNGLWNLKVTKLQLIELAKKLGSDVAYQLLGGVKLEIQGGDKAGELLRLHDLPKCFIVICFPEIFISSKSAYSKIDYDKIGKNNLSELTKALQNQNLKAICKNLHNDFELWTLKQYPLIGRIKREMLRSGALGSLMSGKGSSVFGIFNYLRKAKICQSQLRRKFKQTFLTKPL